MKEINYSLIRTLLIIMVLSLTIKGFGQTSLPEALTTGSMKDQLKYLEDKTRIYENYRAIREDMFQKLKENVTDTLLLNSSRISELNKNVLTLNSTIDTLKSTLSRTKSSLAEMTRTKDSITVLGIEINKSTYNSIMWTFVLILLALLALGFLVFKRNLYVTSETNKELKELKGEFETYRKTTREAREKMSMDHFNEIKRLKGG